MIEVSCVTYNSMIKSLEIVGHASNSNNNDIICAAVSCLSRTVCDITTRLNGINSELRAPKAGNIMLKIHDIDNCIHGRFSGITDFFLIGIIGIKKDYPESIKLKINNKEWYNGSQERWW